MKKKYIYDEKMAEFFLENGGKLFDIDHHNKTGAKYWVFMKDENLENLYIKWNIKCENLRKQ